MLGVEGDMIRAVALMVILRVLQVAMLLLAVDEGPLLIQLKLPGLRGKKPPVPGAGFARAGRPFWRSG